MRSFGPVFLLHKGGTHFLLLLQLQGTALHLSTQIHQWLHVSRQQFEGARQTHPVPCPVYSGEEHLRKAQCSAVRPVCAPHVTCFSVVGPNQRVHTLHTPPRLLVHFLLFFCSAADLDRPHWRCVIRCPLRGWNNAAVRWCRPGNQRLERHHRCVLPRVLLLTSAQSMGLRLLCTQSTFLSFAACLMGLKNKNLVGRKESPALGQPPRVGS